MLPRGWERVDHGRQQMFRDGETEIVLEDLGPATPGGVADDLREIRGVWLDGRRSDTFARMRSLQSPSVGFAPEVVSGELWRRWNELVYDADSASLGGAFELMIAEADTTTALPLERLALLALSRAGDAERREISRQETRTIHGVSWVDIETWDRVSHMDRRRFAYAIHDGGLVALRTERGLFQQTTDAFEALLTSIEFAPAR